MSNVIRGLFVLYVLASVAVAALCIAGFGILRQPLSVLAEICLGSVGILGFWTMIVLMHGYAGIQLSLGKPLFK